MALEQRIPAPEPAKPAPPLLGGSVEPTPHDAARFGRSSPVLRHWLANCEGFRVRSARGRGVVLRVHGLPGTPQTIVVRTRLGARRLLVPADAFEEVVPEERLLTVETSLRRAARGERKPRWNVVAPVVRFPAGVVKLLVVRAASGTRAGGSMLARTSVSLARRLVAVCNKVVLGRGWPLAKRGVRAAGLSTGRVARVAAVRGRVHGARGLRTGGRLSWRLVLMLAGMVRDAGLTLVEIARVSWPRLRGGVVRGANLARATAIFVARRASRAGGGLWRHARETLRLRRAEREEPPLLPGRARE